jgi:hypothetical protein
MPGNTLIEMLNLSGCYAYDLRNKKIIDCDTAGDIPDTISISLHEGVSEPYMFVRVTYIFKKGRLARSYMVSDIETATREIKRAFGEEVAFELLKQALKPGYSPEELKAKIREIPVLKEREYG